MGHRANRPSEEDLRIFETTGVAALWALFLASGFQAEPPSPLREEGQAHESTAKVSHRLPHQQFLVHHSLEHPPQQCGGDVVRCSQEDHESCTGTRDALSRRQFQLQAQEQTVALSCVDVESEGVRSLGRSHHRSANPDQSFVGPIVFPENVAACFRQPKAFRVLHWAQRLFQ